MKRKTIITKISATALASILASAPLSAFAQTPTYYKGTKDLTITLSGGNIEENLYFYATETAGLIVQEGTGYSENKISDGFKFNGAKLDLQAPVDGAMTVEEATTVDIAKATDVTVEKATDVKIDEAEVIAVTSAEALTVGEATSVVAGTVDDSTGKVTSSVASVTITGAIAAGVAVNGATTVEVGEAATIAEPITGSVETIVVNTTADGDVKIAATATAVEVNTADATVEIGGTVGSVTTTVADATVAVADGAVIAEIVAEQDVKIEDVTTSSGAVVGTVVAGEDCTSVDTEANITTVVTGSNVAVTGTGAVSGVHLTGTAEVTVATSSEEFKVTAEPDTGVDTATSTVIVGDGETITGDAIKAVYSAPTLAQKSVEILFGESATITVSSLSGTVYMINTADMGADDIVTIDERDVANKTITLHAEAVKIGEKGGSVTFGSGENEYPEGEYAFIVAQSDLTVGTPVSWNGATESEIVAVQVTELDADFTAFTPVVEMANSIILDQTDAPTDEPCYDVTKYATFKAAYDALASQYYDTEKGEYTFKTQTEIDAATTELAAIVKMVGIALDRAKLEIAVGDVIENNDAEEFAAADFATYKDAIAEAAKMPETTQAEIDAKTKAYTDALTALTGEGNTEDEEEEQTPAFTVSLGTSWLDNAEGGDVSTLSQFESIALVGANADGEAGADDSVQIEFVIKPEVEVGTGVILAMQYAITDGTPLEQEDLTAENLKNLFVSSADGDLRLFTTPTIDLSGVEENVTIEILAAEITPVSGLQSVAKYVASNLIGAENAWDTHYGVDLSETTFVALQEELGAYIDSCTDANELYTLMERLAMSQFGGNGDVPVDFAFTYTDAASGDDVDVAIQFTEGKIPTYELTYETLNAGGELSVVAVEIGSGDGAFNGTSEGYADILARGQFPEGAILTVQYANDELTLNNYVELDGEVMVDDDDCLHTLDNIIMPAGGLTYAADAVKICEKVILEYCDEGNENAFKPLSEGGLQDGCLVIASSLFANYMGKRMRYENDPVENGITVEWFVAGKEHVNENNELYRYGDYPTMCYIHSSTEYVTQEITLIVTPTGRKPIELEVGTVADYGAGDPNEDDRIPGSDFG
ncbi:MAG: hypothetical protein R3Y53_02520 [Bacillota bacterium]